jgi:general secretion pathway protein D
MISSLYCSVFRWAGILSALLLLGCAQQLIRDEATTKLRSGDYESAVSGIEKGLVQYPESVLLRAGLVSARAESVARLIAQAAQERIEGRMDDAQKTLKRAVALDPQNTRLPLLIADLFADRRAQKSLDDARALVGQGKKNQAVQVLEAALRDAPRNAGLIALSRQLQIELRAASEGAGRHLAETRPISLDFRNAPLSSLLEAITRGSGVNFVLDRDVKLDGRATVFLRAAKVEDALDLVLNANQLAYKIIDAQTVLIYPNNPEKTKEHQEQIIRVFYLAHAEAKTTAAFLRSMLRIKDPFIDERANLIALRESADIINVAERLIALHDVAEPEVMLEVEILEVKSSRLTELGVNFPNTFSLTPLSGGGGGGDNSGGASSGLTVDALRDLNSSRIGVGVAGLLVNLRRDVGDFNTLANPRIRTKSREKAKILIGDKVPVITSTAGASGFVSENVSYIDVGLKLDVEPVVSPDDEVLIKLGLEVSSIAREVRSAGGSLAYQIGTRNANTTLRLRDGETQLLGGLISNEDRSSSNRIPGLGDLPIAGRLFSSQRDDYQRSELVLAITPRIVRPAPRADVSQSELWIGSETSTRLKQSPAIAKQQLSTTSSSDLQQSSTPPQPAISNSEAVNIQKTLPANTSATGAIDPSAMPTSLRMLWDAPNAVKVGESFSVAVNAISGQALRGLPMEIAYPADLLEVVAISEGTFLRQGDGSTSFVQANNATTGRINIGLLRNDATGASGNGTVAKIQFKAKSAGSIQLTFTSVRPIGSEGAITLEALPTLNLVVK